MVPIARKTTRKSASSKSESPTTSKTRKPRAAKSPPEQFDYAQKVPTSPKIGPDGREYSIKTGLPQSASAHRHLLSEPFTRSDDAYDASPQEDSAPPVNLSAPQISAPAPSNKPQEYFHDSVKRARNREPARQPEEGPFNLVFKVGNVSGGNHATATGSVISKPFEEGKGQAYFVRIDSYTIPSVTVYGAEGKLTETHPAITGSNILIPLNGLGRSKAQTKVRHFLAQQAAYGQADPTFNEWHDSQFGRKSKFTHKKPRWRR